MAAWEIGEVRWQRLVSPGVFSTDDITLSIGQPWIFRGGFTIANGDEPINTGNFQVQRFVSGAWADWVSYYAINKQPGYSLGVATFQPQYKQWNIGFSHTGDLRTRMCLDWDGGPYYSPEIVVTAQALTWTEATCPSTSWTEATEASASWSEATEGSATWNEETETSASWTESQGVAPPVSWDERG